MMIESNDVIKFLVSILEDTRLKSKGRDTTLGKTYFNAKIETLELLIRFIVDLTKKDETAMEKLKLDLASSLVSLDEIPQRKRRSELEEKIMIIAETLTKKIEEAKRDKKPLPAVMIDNTQIKFGHFATKVYYLKKSGKLDKAFNVKKAGENFYLVKTQ